MATATLSLDMLRQLKMFTWCFIIYNPHQNFIKISSIANNIHEAREEMMRIIRHCEEIKIRCDELKEEVSNNNRKMKQIEMIMNYRLYAENIEYQQLVQRNDEIRRELNRISENLPFEGSNFSRGAFKNRLLILSSTMNIISKGPRRIMQDQSPQMTLEECVLTEEPDIEPFFTVKFDAECTYGY